jgi:sec-independent protein translocase protein TatA
VFGRFGGPEFLLLLLLIVLLFGASRLPKLARSLREARNEFEKGASDDEPAVAESKPEGTGTQA